MTTVTKVTTKEGDNGMTVLLDGTKINKKEKINKCIGDIDELNSYLGIINNIEYPPNSSVTILDIQKQLMLIMSVISSGSSGSSKYYIDSIWTDNLESDITLMENILPKLSHFIIPRHILHIPRTICRRAERRCQIYNGEYRNDIQKYMNRLSDYLFTLARYQNPSYELTYNIRKDVICLSSPPSLV